MVDDDQDDDFFTVRRNGCSGAQGPPFSPVLGVTLMMLRTHFVRVQPGFAMRGAPALYGAPSRIIADNSRRVQPGKFAVGEARRGMRPDESEEKVTAETKEEEKSAKSAPPAPEKPLPGDCCGSGCVRCVWDVYCEELEAYRKISQNDSASDS